MIIQKLIPINSLIARNDFSVIVTAGGESYRLSFFAGERIDAEFDQCSGSKFFRFRDENVKIPYDCTDPNPRAGQWETVAQ